MKKLKLAIEPRPVSTWGVTLANLLPKKEWDQLRYQCYREADYTCVICGSQEKQLHAHEQWSFDDKKKIQRLVDVQCCCVLCHDVHHFGRSSQVYSKKYQQVLISHWCKVNKLTKADFQEHQAQTREISRKRVKVFYVVKVGRQTLE